jgi:hypothetical protein
LVKAVIVGIGDSWLLALPVGLAVEDEFVGGGLQSVDGGLGEECVGHLAEPLNRFTIRRGNRCRGAVSFDDQFVDVGGVEAVEGCNAKSSTMSRSTRNSLRISTSWLLSSREALSRLSRRSQRSKWTVKRRRTAA